MECLTYTVPQGSHSYIQENLFRGNVPKFAVVALVDNAAFNGSYQMNPFDFDHFNVNFVGLYCDGQALPYRTGYRPNFEKNLVAREYFMSIIQNMEHMRKNVNNGITLEDFIDNGKTLFTFNLTPDFCMNQGQPPRKGNMRLELGFSQSLKTTINVIILGVFDTAIQITKNRRIIRG